MNGNDRAVTTFAMLGHATFHAYELVIPVFVAVWIDEFAVAPATLGIVVAVSYALAGVGALPSGILADVYSSRLLVLGCMVGMGVGFAIVSLAPTIPVLAAGLLVWGAAASIYHPAGLALLSRGTVDRPTAFAYHGVAGNVGVAIGPLLAVILLGVFDWRVVALALTLPVLVAVGLAYRLEFEEVVAAGNGGTEPAEDLLPDAPDDLASFLAASRQLFLGGFLLVFLIGNLFGVYIRGAFTFLPEVLAGIQWFAPVELWGREVAPSQYVYSGLLLLGGVGQYVGGKLSNRYRAERVLLATFVALLAVSLLFVPAGEAGVVPMLIVAGALGFLVFMEAPVFQEVLSRHVSPDVRGLSFGYSYVAVFGVGALGAAIAGFILTRWTAAELFLFEAVVVAAAGLVCLYLIRYTDRSSEG